ncbi:MAG: hypothetical protein H6704_17710 [Myxococcales bacterium]|nr:hypothetical protein [Myxococcales bacterium]
MLRRLLTSADVRPAARATLADRAALEAPAALGAALAAWGPRPSPSSTAPPSAPPR